MSIVCAFHKICVQVIELLFHVFAGEKNVQIPGKISFVTNLNMKSQINILKMSILDSLHVQRVSMETISSRDILSKLNFFNCLSEAKSFS